MTFAVTLAAATLAGFIALSYEILWYRAYSFVSQSSPSAFGLVLGAYLTGVAVGSLGSRAFCRDGAAAGRRDEMKKVAAFVFAANVASYLVVPALAFVAVRASYVHSLPLVGLGAGLLGATLPLLCHFGIAPDDRAGARLSYVYVANIVGSAAGSLVTGFVFLELWPLQTVALVLAVLGVALSLFLHLASRPSSRSLSAGLALAALSLGLFVSLNGKVFDGVWDRLLFRKKWSPDRHLTEVIENRHGVIAVDGDTVYGGGAYDGIFNTGLRHDPNWVFRAYAIGALHPSPKTVLMVGLASGSWAKIVSAMPGLERLTVIEINPGYLDLIRRHEEVSSLLTDPKVEIVIDDGRRFLQRHPDRRFDVVVMNTTWHFRAHATNLLSEEFFRTVMSRLEPGGIFHFNTTMSTEAMKTALTVFPHGMRMYNFITASSSPVTFDRERWRELLLAYRLDGAPVLDAEADRARMEQLVALPDTFDGPYRPEAFERRDALLARLSSARMITDDNMRSEWFPDELPSDE
jgi:spermidine synthase